MMLKSIIFSVILALAVCSQQVIAQPQDGSGSANSGQMKTTWSKTGNTLTLTAECPTDGYMAYSFGNRVSNHQAPEAVSCDQTQCLPSKIAGQSAYTALNQNPGNLACQHSNVGGIVKATCTRTIADDDPVFPLGRIQHKMACGPGNYNSSSRHRTTGGFTGQEMVGPAPPVPVPPTPPTPPTGTCQSYRQGLAAQGKKCGTDSTAISCSNIECSPYECCIGGRIVDGPAGGGGGGGGGGMTPTPVGVGGGGMTGGALTPACQTLIQQYAANGMQCAGQQYVPYANQCQIVGQCTPFQCCNVPMTGAAGTVAPTVAAVLASALAMLALLF